MLVVKGLDPRCSNGNHLRSRKNGRQSENFYEVINEIQFLRDLLAIQPCSADPEKLHKCQHGKLLNTGLYSIADLVIGTFR